ncbi:MAG TPA: SgcJ/EcaC family oxidoreductase [Candidatus Polarisedimenticolia bacterium]|jgi:uncharacterized protein (TIGR02246 family)|nr:SgcJ/EcaC family oxidoreductase [Candidatus Polarisedimenticolia bacterium]
MTKMRGFLGLLAVMAIVGAIGAAGITRAADRTQEAKAAIEKVNVAFTRAFERGDAAALAEMYTVDAIVFPPDKEMIKGRDAIGEFWKATRDGGVTSATLTTLDVGRSGDLAYEVGTASLTIQSTGREPTTANAKYVVVWKRAAGSWKLHRDIWNGLPEPK